MAHATRCPLTFYRDGRRIVLQAAEKLEELRREAERLPAARRREAEPALDHLRGLLNRATARLEAARMAGEDPGRFAQARPGAAAALNELLHELAGMENRLPAAA